MEEEGINRCFSGSILGPERFGGPRVFDGELHERGLPCSGFASDPVQVRV